MAPSTRKDNVDTVEEKEEMFRDLTITSVPDAFISLKDVERVYGLSLQVFLKLVVPSVFLSSYSQDLKMSGLLFSDEDEVVKGLRKGKSGIFFSPDFLDLFK